jgi:hypothetical protein
LSFGLERFQSIVPFLQFQRFLVNLSTQTRWDHYSRMQGGGQGETNAAIQTDGNQFRDDELIILEDLRGWENGQEHLPKDRGTAQDRL